MASLIDQGVQKGDTGAILRYGALMLACAFVSLLFGIGGGLFGARASAGFAANLRKGIYDNIQTFSFANIDKFSTAGLITRLTTDVSNVQNAFQMILRIAVRAPLTLILSMIMCFVTSPRMSVIFLVAVVFLSVCLSIIVRMATKRFSVVFERYDDLNASVQENVSAIRVVKAFVREDHERSKFKDVADDVYRTSLKAETIMAFSEPGMMIIMYTCTLLVSWFGAKLVVQNVLTTGLLTTFLNYVMQVLGSMMMLAGIMMMMTMSAAAANRIFEVLNEEPDIKDTENPVMEVKDGSIRFESAGFAYGESRNCLNDINLDIHSGETIGIIGGTGSGKTSLVQLIPRLYDVNDGAVYVGGVNVKDMDLTALRTQVAMVLQKNILFSGTIAENLMWGNPDATEEQMWKALDWAQADFVRTYEDGLEHWVEQGGSNFSGGQRQRLCIARALIGHPKILILDDSTSAVDTHTESLIRQAFAEELPDITKIIIAQRISSVKDADRIVVIDGGRIDGVGTHEELRESNEIYREVYESQTKGGDFDEPN
jgi:ATP-binding cassette subfamily B protein